MTNNQNWPDSAYLERGNYWSPIKRDDSVEYYSADKVREIQLATVRATADFIAAKIESIKFAEPIDADDCWAIAGNSANDCAEILKGLKK